MHKMNSIWNTFLSLDPHIVGTQAEQSTQGKQLLIKVQAAKCTLPYLIQEVSPDEGENF